MNATYSLAAHSNEACAERVFMRVLEKSKFNQGQSHRSRRLFDYLCHGRREHNILHNLNTRTHHQIARRKLPKHAEMGPIIVVEAITAAIFRLRQP